VSSEREREWCRVMHQCNPTYVLIIKEKCFYFYFISVHRYSSHANHQVREEVDTESSLLLQYGNRRGGTR